MGVPALGMRQRHPADERRKVTVLSGPKHEMPVVWQHAIGQKTHLHSANGLVKDSLERFVVLWRAEDLHPGIRPIQHVVHQPAGRCP